MQPNHSSIVFFLLLFTNHIFAQAPSGDSSNIALTVALTVPAGTPLRVYLIKRIPKRNGLAITAKVLDPVYAFDHEVIPAGAILSGDISRTEPAEKWDRVRAIVGGDFTPLRIAYFKFQSIQMPDGRSLPISTVDSVALDSIYVEPSPKKKPPKKPQKALDPNANTGVLGTGKQAAKDQINGQINGRTMGVASLVRGPDKKERFYDFIMSKLPYHPQYLRKGTRIDAELGTDLEFGSMAIASDSMKDLGTQPSPDSSTRARLLTPLDSASAKQGDAIEAVIMQPLFSPDHKLVLPEGTRVTGSVVQVKKATWFHRGGRLRFNFQKIDLPPELAKLTQTAPASQSTQAILESAEASGKTPVKVDSEGGVKATESKTRFIAPVISVLLAGRSADNDAGKAGAAGQGPNVSGRTLGGISGFGSLGAIASQSSRFVGMAFGYYGVAISVYTNIIAKGGEIEFHKNAMIDIKFGGRPPIPTSKFVAAAP
jgi:hypothetical protein